MKSRSLSGRPLIHPDIAHTMAIQESNARECAAIDKFYERMPLSRLSNGPKDRVLLAPRTLHDVASTNPLLRDMLRSLQR